MNTRESDTVQSHVSGSHRDSEVLDKQKFWIFGVYSCEIQRKAFHLGTHVCTGIVHSEMHFQQLQQPCQITHQRQNPHTTAWYVCGARHVLEPLAAHQGVRVPGLLGLLQHAAAWDTCGTRNVLGVAQHVKAWGTCVCGERHVLGSQGLPQHAVMWGVCVMCGVCQGCWFHCSMPRSEDRVCGARVSLIMRPSDFHIVS